MIFPVCSCSSLGLVSVMSDRVSGSKRSFEQQYRHNINACFPSVVPEVPQEVALSGQVVTSVFVTWRAPPGGVNGYKVRHDLHSSKCFKTGIIIIPVLTHNN